MTTRTFTYSIIVTVITKRKMKKAMDSLQIMMEKPLSQEAFELRIQRKVQQYMELIMTNSGLFYIREQIFGYLNYETLENCRKVSELWNQSLERIALVKFLEEFGDKNVEQAYLPWGWLEPEGKVSTILSGWENTAKKYGVQASIKDLRQVKDSLKELVRENGNCCRYPVHEAAKNGNVKFMEFLFATSFEMNTKEWNSGHGITAWHLACWNGKTEIVKLFIKSSKDFGIDLNAEDDDGRTAWHLACWHANTETVQFIIKSSKDFGIDLNARDIYGITAWQWTCGDGRTETARLIIESSIDFGIDLNAKNDYGITAWHEACKYGRTDVVKLIIESSKVFGIALNTKDNDGDTAFHEACIAGKAEIVQVIMKNWEEFGIDIKVQNNLGKTALDLIKHHKGDEYDQIKKMLEKEYSHIEVKEAVQDNK